MRISYAELERFCKKLEGNSIAIEQFRYYQNLKKDATKIPTKRMANGPDLGPDRQILTDPYGSKASRDAAAERILTTLANLPYSLNLAIAWYITDTRLQLDLLDAGADVNGQDKELTTPLMRAIYHDQINVMDVLLAHPKINVNLTNTVGATALLVAVFYAKFDAVHRLVARDDCDLHGEKVLGSTAMELAKKRIWPENHLLKNILDPSKVHDFFTQAKIAHPDQLSQLIKKALPLIITPKRITDYLIFRIHDLKKEDRMKLLSEYLFIFAQDPDNCALLSFVAAHDANNTILKCLKAEADIICSSFAINELPPPAYYGTQRAGTQKYYYPGSYNKHSTACKPEMGLHLNPVFNEDWEKDEQGSKWKALNALL